MKNSNKNFPSNEDSYQRYLEKTEKLKTFNLDLLENLSEEEITKRRIETFRQIDFKKVIAEFCLYLNLKYDFDRLIDYLKGLPSIADKLKVLYNLKYDFEREIEMVKGMPFTEKHFNKKILDFDKACQKEIEKYTILMQLETTDQQTNEAIKKPKGLNRESAFLFFEYLFNFANVDCDKNQRAKVIENLTGYSQKQIIQLFSWFEKEKLKIEENEEIDKKFLDDANFARKCFLLLGLDEVVERIDKDLGS